MSERSEGRLPGRYTAENWAARREERHREADRSERLAGEARDRAKGYKKRVYRLREFPESSSRSYALYASIGIANMERHALSLEALADQYSARAEYLRQAEYPQ